VRVVINLAFLKSEHVGGSWTYSFNLVRMLEKFRHQADFLVLINAKLAAKFASIQLPQEVISINPDAQSSRIFWEQVSLPSILRRYSPDVFHSTGNVLPWRLPCKSVVTIHDFQYYHHPGNFSFPRRQYLSRMVPFSLKHADHIICVSKSTSQDAERLFRIDPARMSVVYEAGLVDGEVAKATEQISLRQQYGLARPFLLSAGSLLPHKNLGRLIKAFGRIVSRIPHDLVIVGESFGNDPEVHNAVKHELSDQQDRVKISGFVSRDDLLGLYNHADAFVFPSVFEGFGIPILEAMGCGCPVVASRCTSIPEIAEEAVEYFEPTDFDDIASTILRVCQDSKLRASLRERGFSQARKFSWEKMADETMAVYRKVSGVS